MTISPIGGAAAHTFWRATAAAFGMALSSTEHVAWIARQAVATDATGPNSSSCSFSAARSARQSAPLAMDTAKWVGTTPGSWVFQEIPQSSMAIDMANVNPLRSAISQSSASPAWLIKFFPSAITLAPRTDRLRFTVKEPASWLRMLVVVTAILPVQEGFFADTRTTY